MRNLLILLILLVSCEDGFVEYEAAEEDLQLSSLAAQSITEGSYISFDVNTKNGTDLVNSSAVTYTCTYDTVVDNIVSSGASNCSVLSISFQSSTGKFVWQPSVTDAGVYEIKISASGGGMSTSSIFKLTVIDYNFNPSLTSIVRKAAETNPTNSTSVIFTVNFDNAVTGVDVTDFLLTTTSTASGNIASVSSVTAYQYEVTVDTIAGDGTIRLDLADVDSDIIDGDGLILSATSQSGNELFTIDNTGPTLSSIERQTPSSQNTNATSVTYRVTFDEVVTGVEVGDFSLTQVSGTPTGSITSVTNQGSGVWDVLVNTVAGDGDMRLDFSDAATAIVDGVGNAITSSTYNSGEVYTIINPEDVASITAKVKSSTDIELSWPADNSYGKYVVAYAQGTTAPSNCSSGTVIPYTSITGESHRITGLDYATNYAFRICSVYTDGSYASSGTTHVKMLEMVDIGGFPFAHAYDGTYFYLLDTYVGSKIHIYDFSSGPDISSSTYVATINVPDFTFYIEVFGDILMARTELEGIDADVYLYDITDPTNPALLSSVDPSGVGLSNATSVTIEGDYLYVPLENGEVHIYDISTPASPTLLATYTSPSGDASAVQVSGNTMFVAAGDFDANSTSEIESIDISDVIDGAAPYTFGAVNTYEVPTGGFFEYMRLVGTKLYLTQSSSAGDEFVVLDVTATDFSAPAPASLTLSNAGDMKIVGNYAYVGQSTSVGGDVYVVDITAAPSLSTTITGQAYFATADSSGLLAMGTSNTEISFYDINTTPGTPSLLDTYDFGVTVINDIAIKGEYLFATSSAPGAPISLGLRVIDVSDLAAPNIVYTDLAFPSVKAITFVGDYLYYESGGDLYYTDFSDPTTPGATASIVLGDANKVNFMHTDGGNYLALAHDTSYAISVVDVTTPNAPSVVGVPFPATVPSFPTGFVNNPVQVKGGYVIALTSATQIDVLDATTALSVNSYNAPLDVYTYIVHGDGLILSMDDGSGATMLLSYDITDPSTAAFGIEGSTLLQSSLIYGTGVGKVGDALIFQDTFYGIRSYCYATVPTDIGCFELVGGTDGYSHIGSFSRHSFAELGTIYFENSFGMITVTDIQDQTFNPQPVYGRGAR